MWECSGKRGDLKKIQLHAAASVRFVYDPSNFIEHSLVMAYADDAVLELKEKGFCPRENLDFSSGENKIRRSKT